LRKPFYFLLTVLFWFWAASGFAQENEIVSIPNQPSSEAYDLLKDRNGYIWVAHEFGVSRYDGANFISLRHPRQNSVALTGLIEDKNGRIWCHNFSGQIFYIENLQLHLLEAYNYLDEQDFPRMVICGDELVATSKKGLFVYNLITGESTYHYIRLGTNSLAQVGNKIICYNGFEFFGYESGKPLIKLTLHEKFHDIQLASLQKVSLNDTCYLVVNTKGVYYKMTQSGTNLRIQAVVKTGAFINTISKLGKDVWINTHEHSFTTNGKERIAGMNLSDIVTDNHGNRWMSSLKKGLCVQYSEQPIKNLDDSLSIRGHNVRRLHTEAGILFLGKATGRLCKMTDSGRLQPALYLPKEAGAIERMSRFIPGHLFIAASVESFAYNYVTNTLKRLPVGITVKDVAVHRNTVYFATPTGIKYAPLAQLLAPNPPVVSQILFNKTTRCRSIALLDDSLVAVYNDGVFLLTPTGMKPLLYKQHPIYASTVRTVGRKVLIGTYNQGLLIYENGRFQNLTGKEGLTSDFIMDIKTINGATWLIYPDRFQLLNQDFSGVVTNSFAFSKGGINDFSTLGNQVYFSTSDGLYTLQQTSPVAIATQTFIDNVIVNGKPLVSTRLKHFQNHLRFQVSTPYFSPYAKITYQYRIKNTPSSTWQFGAPGQTAFNMVALEPGVYDFEIVAIDENRKEISKPALFHFEILLPWYQHWLFKTSAVLVVVVLVCCGIWVYYRSRLRQQRRNYEKQLTIQAERQRISEEIHDDIGAGLLAMRLQSEMTKNKLPESEARKEVEKIHASISELSHKMKEVVWSLNTDNDQLQNLLFYIRRQALTLFENSSISLRVVFPAEDIPAITIHGEKRRHIYLAVKEALHNCLKHSEARNCTLTMRIEDNALYVTVADDGKGFVAHQKAHTGNGLRGMKKRMQQIEGVLDIETNERTFVHFMVPLNENV
jgi:signal transduction histidine kinase